MNVKNKELRAIVTEEEKRFVFDEAKMYGMGTGEFILRCVRNKKVADTDLIRSIIAEQKAIGMQLDKVIYLANHNMLTDVDIEPVIKGQIKITENIGRLIKEMK